MHASLPRRQVAFRAVLFIISCAVVLALTAPFARAFRGIVAALFIGAATALGSFALTLLFVRWDDIGLSDVGALPRFQSVSRLAFGFGTGLLLVALHSSLQAAFGHVRWVRTPGVGFVDTSVSLLAYLALASREELAFHGYPLRRLEPRFGLWGAQCLIAAIFAVEHVLGGWTWESALAGAGVGSLLFGMASVVTKGLAVPIGLHAAWNFTDWVRGGKEAAGFWRPVVETGFEEHARVVGQISYVFLMLTTTLAFWACRRLASRQAGAPPVGRPT